jgi:hypothetical protein
MNFELQYPFKTGINSIILIAIWTFGGGKNTSTCQYKVVILRDILNTLYIY